MEKKITVHLSGANYTSEIKAGRHVIKADEPISFGGNDLGPSPYDLLASALGACTAMTIRWYAIHKKWDVKEVIVNVAHEKVHAEDCAGCESEDKKTDQFFRTIELKGTLSEEQRIRLLNIAEKCPVHKTLQSMSVIETKLIRP